MVPTRKVGSAGFKQKRNTGPVHWEWQTFSNPARSDPQWGELKLRHWVKSSLEYPEYPFARFNKRLDVMKYTQTEYEQHLQVGLLLNLLTCQSLQTINASRNLGGAEWKQIISLSSVAGWICDGW
jgi:hypothetical protein